MLDISSWNWATFFLQLTPKDKIWKTVDTNKAFLIRHYAGDVVYSVDGFLDKNRDTLFDDFKRLLYHSENPIISAMWPDGDKSITSVTRRPLTVGSLFRTSMLSLSSLLSSKVKLNWSIMRRKKDLRCLATIFYSVYQTKWWKSAQYLRSSIDRTSDFVLRITGKCLCSSSR